MYELTWSLLEKGIAFVNVCALLSFNAQFKGTVGSNGISPASNQMERLRNKFMKKITIEADKSSTETEGRSIPKTSKVFDWKKAYWRFPILFWISAKDWFIRTVVFLGVAASVLAFFGIVPGWMFLISAWCYLSLHTIGQPWMGLQMHVTVLETNFVYIIGSPFRSINPFMLVFMFRYLVWRIMLGCGACKYGSGDPTWRDGTAMHFHYWTQPIPNPLSWYFAHQPDWALRASVVGTHLIEGPLTFLAFGGVWCRAVALVLFVGLNLMINVSGNYGFLGILTTVQCFSLIDESLVQTLAQSVLPQSLQPAWVVSLAGDSLLSGQPMWGFSLLSWEFVGFLLSWLLVGVPYLAISFVPLVSTFHRSMPWINESIQWLQQVGLPKQPTLQTTPLVQDEDEEEEEDDDDEEEDQKPKGEDSDDEEEKAKKARKEKRRAEKVRASLKGKPLSLWVFHRLAGAPLRALGWGLAGFYRGVLLRWLGPEAPWHPFRTRWWVWLSSRVYGGPLSPFTGWHLVNRYAKFGTMTCQRQELQLELCWSEDPSDVAKKTSGPDSPWKELIFRYRPSGPVQELPAQESSTSTTTSTSASSKAKNKGRPALVPFMHMPGLDWQFWFLPHSVVRYGSQALPAWYFEFVKALLEGRQDVLDLLGENGFDSSNPPKYVRAVLYDYHFTPPGSPQGPKVDTEHGKGYEVGPWWQRKRLYMVHKPISIGLLEE